MRVHDLSSHASLVGQAGPEHVVSGECRVERLDRHDAAIRRATAVDDTDRTPSELELERVVAESQCLRHGRILLGKRREGARLPVGQDPLPGSEIAGFRLEELLGRGGMGAVYRAEDVRLGRKVALKLLVPELAESERFRERFFRESKVAASLDHPHIVPIYAAGDADGRLYLAMRYVEGYDLRQLIAREAPLDPDRAMRLIEQVGDALDAAHERGLVHRDVKPANVLIAGRSGREHCYLTDFGLTKQTSSISGLTGTGELVGTIEYVSPEQIRGETVDARADVYSLGCVLYECLAGERPFARDSEVATLWAHVNEPPPSLATTHPELGSEIDSVMARALAKAPGDRYEDLRRARRVRPRRARATRCVVTVDTSASQARAPPHAHPLARARARAGRRCGGRRSPRRDRRRMLLRGSDGLTGIRPLSVGVIDPSSSDLVADIPVGFESSLIAAGEGFVWVLDPKASTLDEDRSRDDGGRRADPRGSRRRDPDRARRRRGVGLGRRQRGTRSRAARDRTGARRGAPPHRSPDDPDGDVLGLARGSRPRRGGNAVWALERGQGEVTRIDPQTGTPKRLAEGHGASSSIAAGGGAVWLGGINGVIEARSGDRRRARQHLRGRRSSTRRRPRSRSAAAAVWFTGSSSARLWHIDRGGETVLDSFPVGAGPSAVAVGDEGIVWVASSVDESVWRVDSDAELGREDRARCIARRHRHAFRRVWTSPGTPLR